MKLLAKIPRLAAFIAFYLRELALSNIRVAIDAVTPPQLSRPGIIAFETKATKPMEIFLLANLISMTPGTVTLDVSSDRRVLYIHAMFIDDADTLRREIADNLERRVLELLR